MVEQLVDVLAKQLQQPHGLAAPRPCRSGEVPPAGGDAAGWDRARRRRRRSVLPAPGQSRIMSRHGAEAEHLLDLVAAEPALAKEVHPGLTVELGWSSAQREQQLAVYRDGHRRNGYRTGSSPCHV